jgi:hypothetical protein
MTIKVSLNDEVKFRLHDYSEQRYGAKKDDEALLRKLRIEGATEGDDGYYEMCLWEFIKIFNSYIELMEPTIFVNNEIIL